MSAPARPRSRNAGFTLFEMLVAVAVMGLIMSLFATVTARWLPDWGRGLVRVQRNEQIMIAFDRVAADIAAAEYVAAAYPDPKPLFEGDEQSVTFVRSALGPNSRPGLEIVRIVETVDATGQVLVRLRAPYTPSGVDGGLFGKVAFGDPVVLLRAPFRVSFAFAGTDRVWRNAWIRKDALPSVVRFTVRDGSRPGVAMSTAARVRVEEGAPKPQPDVTQ